MSEKPRKRFRITCLDGNREIEAESKAKAWQIAVTRGWKPLFIQEIAKDEGAQ